MVSDVYHDRRACATVGLSYSNEKRSVRSTVLDRDPLYLFPKPPCSGILLRPIWKDWSRCTRRSASGSLLPPAPYQSLLQSGDMHMDGTRHTSFSSTAARPVSYFWGSALALATKSTVESHRAREIAAIQDDVGQIRVVRQRVVVLFACWWCCTTCLEAKSLSMTSRLYSAGSAGFKPAARSGRVSRGLT